jgi:hypothetical protein
MSSGGGGTSGTQNVTQTTTVQMYPEVEYFMKPFLNEAQYLSDLPYKAYTKDRVAPLSEQQKSALGGLEYAADTSIMPAIGSSVGQMQGLVENAWLTPSTQYAGKLRNPWAEQFTATNPWANYATGVEMAWGENPFAYGYTANPLYGMNNAFLNAAIGEAQEDVMREYRNTVEPSLTTARAQAGSFGNTGLEQLETQRQRALMEQLADISTGMRYENYGLQAQLGEADVARQQAERQSAAQIFEQQRAQALQQYSQLTGLKEAELGRQQADIARASELEQQRLSGQLAEYEAERGRQMQALGMLPQIAQLQLLPDTVELEVGQYYQDQAKLEREEDYQQWLAAQQWPYQGLDVMANALRTAIAGGGGTTTTSAPSAYYQNPYASAIGGGLAGYGAAAGAGMDYPWLGGLLGAAAGYMA